MGALILTLSAVGALTLGTHTARAATYTWGTTTSGALWSASGSWTPAVVPSFAAGDTFDLSTLDIAAATTSTMDTVGGNTLGTIKIGDTNNTHSWTLSLSTALTLNGNGSAAVINQISTSKGDTISGAGGIVLASDLTLNNASGNGLLISSAIGSSTAGTKTITNSGAGAGAVTLSGVISNASGSISIVQNSSTSALTMSTVNSYSGGTYIKQGTLNITTNNGVLGSGTIFLGDATLNLDATLAGNHANISQAVSVSGSGVNKITMNDTGNSFQTVAGGGLTLNSANLTLSSVRNSSSGMRVTGNITGTGNITVDNANGGATELRGAVNNTGTVTNQGTGSMTLNTAGTGLSANVTGIIQNSATSTTNINNSSSASFVGYAEIRSGTMTTNSTTGLRSGNELRIGSGATFAQNADTLTIAGLNDYSGAGGTYTRNSGTTATTVTLGGTSGTFSYSGAITNGTATTMSLAKTGASIQTLSGTNTYSGTTSVSGGTLKLGSISALGTSTVTVASGGTLDLNGKAITNAFGTNSTRGTLTNTGAAVDLSATTITNNGTFTADGSGDITLGNVTGTSGNNLIKNGGNTLTLSGNADNAFLHVTVNAGTVNLNKTVTGQAINVLTQTGGTVKITATTGNQLTDSAGITLGGGTFDLNNQSETVGQLTITTGVEIINFGSIPGANTFTFADSSAATWTGTITLQNFEVGTDALRFGTTNAGLTGGQLSAISLSGYTASSLNASGFVQFTAVPEPNEVALAVAGMLGLVIVFRRRRHAM